MVGAPSGRPCDGPRTRPGSPGSGCRAGRCAVASSAGRRLASRRRNLMGRRRRPACLLGSRARTRPSMSLPLDPPLRLIPPRSLAGDRLTAHRDNPWTLTTVAPAGHPDKPAGGCLTSHRVPHAGNVAAGGPSAAGSMEHRTGNSRLDGTSRRPTGGDIWDQAGPRPRSFPGRPLTDIQKRRTQCRRSGLLRASRCGGRSASSFGNRLALPG